MRGIEPSQGGKRNEQGQTVLPARDPDGDLVSVGDHPIVVHRAAHEAEDPLQFVHVLLPADGKSPARIK